MIADSHCDTISVILDNGVDLLKNDLQLDLERFKNVGGGLQFFAAFIAPEHSGIGRAVDIFDKFYLEYEKNKEDMFLVKSVADLDLQPGKIGALLTIEGGEALGGKISALRMFYRLGVRGMTLTWNGRNELADGVGEGDTAGGLSLFGREVVREMNDLGMFVDVSHLSEKGFWDVVEITQKPIIATHSNCKSLCSHARNLTDEQIKAIVDMNGMIGINFYSDFLNDSEASIDDIVRHIDRMLGLGAENCVGFGADLDGVERLPKGFAGVQDFPKVIELLKKAGYSEQLVEKVCWGNMIRYLKTII